MRVLDRTMVKKKKAAPADGLKGQDTAVKQDPLAYLGENVMVVVLGRLEADDCARCTSVSKIWEEYSCFGGALDATLHGKRVGTDVCTRHA